MDGTEFKYPVGKRVRLRGDVDPGFYGGLGKAGNEGWIGGHRRDKRFGLPEVFIRWDPDHWAYNRQPDAWTFQEHFDPVEESAVSDRQDAAQQAAIEFANRMSAIFQSDPPVADPAVSESVPQPSLPAAEDSDTERFLQTAHKAAETLAGSEAFMVIAITREPHPEAIQGLLISEAFGDSLTPDAEALMGAQLSAAGAQFHKAAAFQQVKAIAEQRTEVDGGSST